MASHRHPMFARIYPHISHAAEHAERAGFVAFRDRNGGGRASGISLPRGGGPTAIDRSGGLGCDPGAVELAAMSPTRRGRLVIRGGEIA